MNKYKALGLGVLFLMLAISVLMNGGGIVAVWFVVPAIWYLAIAGYQLWRDWSIVNQAKIEREQAAQRPQVMPPATSSGSRRLFVPPPREK